MRKTLKIDTDNDVVTCEMEMGSILLLNNLIPHRSLENYSNQIRWSLDLRWQNPLQSNGFHGLKENLLMRSAMCRNPIIDWDSWNNQDRSTLQGSKNDDFDTTISGPWMKEWPIKQHNRHTVTLDSQWHKA